MLSEPFYLFMTKIKYIFLHILPLCCRCFFVPSCIHLVGQWRRRQGNNNKIEMGKNNRKIPCNEKYMKNSKHIFIECLHRSKHETVCDIINEMTKSVLWLAFYSFFLRSPLDFRIWRSIRVNLLGLKTIEMGIASLVKNRSNLNRNQQI